MKEMEPLERSMVSSRKMLVTGTSAVGMSQWSLSCNWPGT